MKVEGGRTHLIQYEVLPPFLFERSVVLHCDVVGCDTNVKRIVLTPALPVDKQRMPSKTKYWTTSDVITSTHHSLLLPLFEGAEVGEDLEGWAPLLQLQLPVEHD